MRVAAVCVAVAAALAGACGGDAPPVPAPPPPPTWACPDGWVALSAGGCGPAALVCGSPSDAAPGACEGAPTEPTVDAPREDHVPAALAALDPGFVDCPEGFAADADGACGAVLREDCPEGTGPLPGGACTPTGLADCPETEYPEVPSDAGDARVVHVRAGADSAVADGSVDRPFAALREAFEAARPDALLLVAAGTYAGTFLLVPGGERLRVLGACAARVRLENDHALFYAEGGAAGPSELELAGLSLGSAREAVRAFGGHARLHHVVFDRASVTALLAQEGGEARIEDSLITTTLAMPTGMGLRPEAHGLFALGGGRITARRVSLVDQGGAAILSSGADSVVALEDVVVRDTRADAEGLGGVGVEAYAGGAVSGRGVVVRGSRGAALRARRGALDLTDVDARDVEAVEELSGRGFVVEVTSEGSARLAGAHLVGGHGATVQVDAGSSFSLEAATVRGAVPPSGGSSGVGVSVAEGEAWLTDVDLREADNGGVRLEGGRAELDGVRIQTLDTLVRANGIFARGGEVVARRVLLRGVPEHGVRLQEGASAEITSLWVDGVPAACADQTWGWGVRAESGASLVLADARIDGVTGVGLGAERDTTVRASDVAITRTATCPDGRVGLGVYAATGATVTLERALVSRVHNLGLYAYGATVTLTDALFEELVAHPEIRTAASAILVSPGTLVAERLLVRDVQEAAIGGLFGAHLELTDVTIRGVSPGARGFGVGVGVSVGADAVLRRVAVEHTAGGALLAMSGSNLGLGAAGNARLSGADVFVRDVSSQTVQYDPTAGGGVEGRAVAYGVHVGARCAVDLSRAVIARGGYGFFVAPSARSLRLDEAVIREQLDAAGATAGPAEDVLVLERADLRDNATDEVVVDAALPEATALPAPSAVCFDVDCG